MNILFNFRSCTKPTLSLVLYLLKLKLGIFLILILPLVFYSRLFIYKPLYFIYKNKCNKQFIHLEKEKIIKQ